MPVEIHSADDGRGTILIGRGIVSGQEILDAIGIRFSSPGKVKAYLYGLAGYSDVERFDVSNAEIECIAQRDMEAA